MRAFYTFFAAALCSAGVAAELQAQERTFRAEEITIDDDGAGGTTETITIQAPTLSADQTLVLPGGGNVGERLEIESIAGSVYTLGWDATGNDRLEANVVTAEDPGGTTPVIEESYALVTGVNDANATPNDEQVQLPSAPATGRIIFLINDSGSTIEVLDGGGASLTSLPNGQFSVFWYNGSWKDGILN